MRSYANGSRGLLPAQESRGSQVWLKVLGCSASSTFSHDLAADGKLTSRSATFTKADLVGSVIPLGVLI